MLIAGTKYSPDSNTLCGINAADKSIRNTFASTAAYEKDVIAALMKAAKSATRRSGYLAGCSVKQVVLPLVDPSNPDAPHSVLKVLSLPTYMVDENQTPIIVANMSDTWDHFFLLTFRKTSSTLTFSGWPGPTDIAAFQLAALDADPSEMPGPNGEQAGQNRLNWTGEPNPKLVKFPLFLSLPIGVGIADFASTESGSISLLGLVSLFEGYFNAWSVP
jgi:hypothetical protein